MVTEPSVILNVLGTLIKKPDLLENKDLYKFSLYDFEDRVYQIIYSTIYNLYMEGVTKIDLYSIDTYLKNYPKHHKIFKDNMEVISDAIDFAEISNFKYYYDRLKKYSALRKLRDNGFDVSKYLVLNDNVDFQKIADIQNNFDNTTIQEIFNNILTTYTELEEEYVINKSHEYAFVGKGLKELKESLQTTPELGLPMLGDIYSTVCRGARITKFYLDSGVTGSGKSRRMAGNACHLAYEQTYDWISHSWKETGYNEKVVMITTEMTLDELQTVMLSYVSGVNEDKLLNGTYTFEENEIINQSIEIIENNKNLIIDRLPDYDVNALKSRIRHHVAKHDVKYVFFDYIHTTPSAMGQFGGYGLREDVVLGLVSAALKDLCNELDIFIHSATQLNGRWEDAKVRNQNLIRGSKAIADKIDVGTITLPITEEEKEFCKKISSNLNVELPNMVTDVYKARRSKYTPPMRIWSYVDLGTARIKNLYATDLLYNPISVDIVEIEYQDRLSEKHKVDTTQTDKEQEEKKKKKEEEKEEKKKQRKEQKEEKQKQEYKQKFDFS